MAHGGPGELWLKLQKTWDQIDEITKLSPLLEPQLQALQKAVGELEGTLRKDGLKVIEGGKIRYGKEK